MVSSDLPCLCTSGFVFRSKSCITLFKLLGSFRIILFHISTVLSCRLLFIVLSSLNRCVQYIIRCMYQVPKLVLICLLLASCLLPGSLFRVPLLLVLFLYHLGRLHRKMLRQLQMAILTSI